MDALELVMIGIAAWLVLSGPVALLLGQLLRSRAAVLPTIARRTAGDPTRMLVSAGR